VAGGGGDWGKNQMSLNMLAATMRFITRIPVPEKWADGVEFRHYGQGVRYFPVVGCVVGGLAAFVAVVASQSGGGIYVGALVYVLALAFLTGGFHLDGLADTCDGIFSARKRERMLEIMRDSRLGTHGGLALIFCILIKTFAVISLSQFPAKELFTLLLCAPVAGRAAMVLAMYKQRYARAGEGMGNIYIGQISGYQAAITLLIGALIVGLFAGMRGLIAILVTYVVVYGVASYFRRQLGGQTGDTLGASEEVGEMVFLLALLWA